jgi:non-canonical poly(A) RNA polymerase PAPD5/7
MMAYDSRYPPPPGSYSLPPPPSSLPPPPPPPPPPRNFGSRETREAPYPGADTYRPLNYGNNKRHHDRYDGRYNGDRSPDHRRAQDSTYHAGALDRSYPSKAHLPPPPPTYDSFRPTQSDFTFRAEKPSGVGDSSYDRYPPNGYYDGPPRGPRQDRNRRDRPRNEGRRPNHDNKPSSSRHSRPYFFQASNRPMLRGQPRNGAEVNYADADRGVTYRALENLSDSDEAEMDMSGTDDERPSAKRARTSQKQEASAESAPRWSNPDPYTALPPPDASQTKKKDVVQLIRKARVQAEKDHHSGIPEVAAEFISCDFSDSDEDKEQEAGPVVSCSS